MARKPRIHLPGGLYHVIFRGNGGQPVFHSDDDRYRLYLLLQEGTCRFGYRIHAFCFMTNHIHLAIQAGDQPLSRGMQNLAFRYTRWINWRQKRTGHLFQGRFKAILVDADSYLLELVRYIHLNPVRVGMVAGPDDYPWSSHRAYLGLETLPWLTTNWLLEQFGATSATAMKRYRAFVRDGVNEERRPEFHGAGTDSRLLGDDSFMDRCLASVGETQVRLTAQQIVDGICRAYGIAVTELQSASQRRMAAEARAAAGWLARESECVSLTEIASRVHRDVGSISSAVRRLSERANGDTALLERLVALKLQLEG